MSDSKLQQVFIQHYRWCRFHHAWRVDPDGGYQADQTLRIRHLAACLWTLQLSLRGVACFTAVRGSRSRMTVVRDVKSLADDVQKGTIGETISKHSQIRV